MVLGLLNCIALNSKLYYFGSQYFFWTSTSSLCHGFLVQHEGVLQSFLNLATDSTSFFILFVYCFNMINLALTVTDWVFLLKLKWRGRINNRIWSKDKGYTPRVLLKIHLVLIHATSMMMIPLRALMHYRSGFFILVFIFILAVLFLEFRVQDIHDEQGKILRKLI